MDIRKEALKRIETLEKECGLSVNLAESFKKGEVLYSCVTPQKWLGRMRKLSSNKKYERIVKTFEKENENYIVYHVVHSETYMGDILSILFVSDEPDEWEMERLENGYIGRLSVESRKSLFAGEHLEDTEYEERYRPKTGQGLVLIDGQDIQPIQIPYIKDKERLKILLRKVATEC